MLKKPIWSAIETTLFYYSGDMYCWSSLQFAVAKLQLFAPFKIEKNDIKGFKNHFNLIT